MHVVRWLMPITLLWIFVPLRCDDNSLCQLSFPLCSLACSLARFFYRPISSLTHSLRHCLSEFQDIFNFAQQANIGCLRVPDVCSVRVGTVMHAFVQAGVAVVEVSKSVRVGDVLQLRRVAHDVGKGKPHEWRSEKVCLCLCGREKRKFRIYI